MLTGFVLANVAAGGLTVLTAPLFWQELLELRYPRPLCSERSDAPAEDAASSSDADRKVTPHMVGGPTALSQILAKNAGLSLAPEERSRRGGGSTFRQHEQRRQQNKAGGVGGLTIERYH